MVTFHNHTARHAMCFAYMRSDSLNLRTRNAQTGSQDDSVQPSWFQIRDKSNTVTGHVMFALSIGRAGDSDALGVLPEVSLDSLSLESANMDSVGSGGAEEEGMVTGIKVVVTGGRGMPKMDSRFFSFMGGGKCDPYLKISCGGETLQTHVSVIECVRRAGSIGSQMIVCVCARVRLSVSECEFEQVCKRTLTPAWNETLSLKLPPRAGGAAEAELLVEAYDYDLVCALTHRIHGSGV